MIASGIRSNAFATLLIHESSRCGNMVIHVGRLRDGVLNNMDSSEILAIRMGRTRTMSKLQVSTTGRLLPSGAENKLKIVN